MKIVFVIFTCILTLFPISATSFLRDDIWYIGAKCGLVKYYRVKFYSNIFNNCFRDIIINSHQLAPGCFLGYRADESLGFELGYNCLGSMSYMMITHTGTVDIKDVELVAKLYYPIIDSVTFYTKLGCSVWRVNVKGVYSGENRYPFHNCDVGISPLISAGIEYRFSNALSAHCECQLLNKMGDVTTVGARANCSVVNLGLIYYFKY